MTKPARRNLSVRWRLAWRASREDLRRVARVDRRISRFADGEIDRYRPLLGDPVIVALDIDGVGPRVVDGVGYESAGICFRLSIAPKGNTIAARPDLAFEAADKSLLRWRSS